MGKYSSSEVNKSFCYTFLCFIDNNWYSFTERSTFVFSPFMGGMLGPVSCVSRGEIARAERTWSVQGGRGRYVER